MWPNTKTFKKFGHRFHSLKIRFQKSTKVRMTHYNISVGVHVTKTKNLNAVMQKSCIIEYPSSNAKWNKKPLKKFSWKRFIKHNNLSTILWSWLDFLSKVMFKCTKSCHFKTRYRVECEFIIINRVILWNFVFTFCTLRKVRNNFLQVSHTTFSVEKNLQVSTLVLNCTEKLSILLKVII